MGSIEESKQYERLTRQRVECEIAPRLTATHFNLRKVHVYLAGLNF